MYKRQEWTELSYELSEERKIIAQTAIDEAIKLMPYVLTFNADVYKRQAYRDIRYNRPNEILNKLNALSADAKNSLNVKVSYNENYYDCLLYTSPDRRKAYHFLTGEFSKLQFYILT